MNPTRAVRTGDPRWLAAVAELPASARLAPEVEGSIVVVTGEVGWGSRVRRAVDGGAAGIVLADPRSVSPDEVTEARRHDRPVPVVVERSRLRLDVAGDARSGSPAVVQVELGASRQELEAVLRDAIGWGRTLTGGSLELVEVTAAPRGLVALLRRADAAAQPHAGLVTLLATRAGASAAWIRATALAGDRAEVVVDRRTSVVLTTVEGALRVPPRFESSARLALRRSIACLAEATGPTDLADLDHDSRLASAILAG